MFWRLSSVKALVYDVPVTNENSKAKPIAAHLKSCGIWEKFGRAVGKNSKQISESTSELSVRNGHFGNPPRSSNVTGNGITICGTLQVTGPLQSSNVTSNSEPLLTLKERRRGPKPQLEAHRHQCAGCLSRAHVNKGAEIWLNHTPHATAVYASCSALPPPHATLASRRLARPYLRRTCTG
jgi:hypothetical protein